MMRVPVVEIGYAHLFHQESTVHRERAQEGTGKNATTR